MAFVPLAVLFLETVHAWEANFTLGRASLSK